MQQLLSYRMNRRAVLGAAAGLGIGVLLLKNDDKSCAAPLVSTARQDATPKHNMWVWRFDVDGKPDQVLEKIRGSGMGVILKTNEADDWMSAHDSSPTAITGPDKVREMAHYFESAGVPFHAWCVVKGLNPEGEARICSEVLDAGARSMVFDLEPAEGHHYWQADPAAALAFGREIRRLQPNARLGVAPDSRPWQIDAVPTVEFASFCDEILPQSYWQTFNSPTNRRFLTERGYHIGPEGVTPEVVLDATADKLRPLGKVIRPIGQGTANAAEWERFIRHAYLLEMDSVSVWRYGTASNDVWPTLHALAPAPPSPVAAAPAESAPIVVDAAQSAPPAPDAAAEHAPPVDEAFAAPASGNSQEDQPAETSSQSSPQPTPVARVEGGSATSVDAGAREDSPSRTVSPLPQPVTADTQSCEP